MLSSVRRPTCTYDLGALATEACVTVGRETDAHIQLDSQDVPCLLSRRHANLVVQPGGHFTIVDLGSTNGTFAARANQPLRKLQAGFAWELQHGDTVGFGGPETIIVKREQVANPFLFKYYAFPEAELGTLHSGSPGPSGAPQPESPFHASDGTGRTTPHAAAAVLRRHAAAGVAAAAVAAAGPSGLNDVMCAGSDQLDHVAGIGRGGMPVHARGGGRVYPPPHHAHHSNNNNISRSNSMGKDSLVGGHSSAASTPRSNKMVDAMCGHLSCPVCCDWLVASHTLSCGHMFCGLCLATWLSQNHSCPSCRKSITSLPVRCFQVDAAVGELLSLQQQPPAARKERKRKQEHWNNIQRHVVQDWATALQRRRDAAVAQALRHNQEMQFGADGNPMMVTMMAPPGAGPMPAAAFMTPAGMAYMQGAGVPAPHPGMR